MPKVSGVQVAVIGGGVVGAACARALSARGLSVRLMAPPPDPAAASPAAAGMLAAQIEHGDGGLLTLGVRGRERCIALATELQDATGIDTGCSRMGIATLAFSPERENELRRTAQTQRQAGLQAEWLDRRDLEARWPGIAPKALGALFAPDDGTIDPAAFTQALIAEAVRLGARHERATVTGLTREGRRLAAVVTEAGRIPIEHAVLAAGAWSPRLNGLPRPLPVEPVRGQMIATPWPATLPEGVFYHGKGYALKRGAQAMLGSTMERVGFDAATTDEGLSQIRRVAAEVFPAFADLPASRTWAGLRPVTPDGHPIIGEDPELMGLWYATGHGRNGILLAAITGDIIADLLADGRTATDLQLLDPLRFAKQGR